METQTGTLTAADGTRLFVRMWAPEKTSGTGTRGTLILVHGYADHSGRYEHVAAYFVGQGYAVYAMDSRGHGRTEGGPTGYFERFTELSDDLAHFVEHVNGLRNKSRPMYMIGHSMGGLLALHYVIRHKPPMITLRGLVTSGALLDAGEGEPPYVVFTLRNVLSPMTPKAGMRALDSTTVSKDPAVVKAYDEDPYIYHGKVMARPAAEFIVAREFVLGNLNQITLPILITHGGADRLVRPSCAQVIYDNVGSPDKSLKIYEGLHHEIFNEPERARVLADVWVWLASHAGTNELRMSQVTA